MIWKFTVFCYFLVAIHGKRYDTARDCVAFVPGKSDPNLYRNINFLTVPISFHSHSISPQNYHIIPTKTLRKFFNSALHSKEHRVPFIRMLELSHFARGKYLQSVSNDLERFIQDLDHVRFNICDSDHWSQMARESRELITRALDHYGRFVRTMFIEMPLNLVKGPEKKCVSSDTEIDESLQHIVGQGHFKHLKAVYRAMETNDLGSAIDLLFTLLRNNPKDRPFEYHESNWFYDSEKDCYDVVIPSMPRQNSIDSNKFAHDTTWYNPYEVQFPFTIDGKQYFYAQNTKSMDWFIRELFASGAIGDETDSGHWNNVYRVQFPFSVGGKQYFYAQNTDTRYWFIQEILSNGKMGKETANGRWNNVYRIQFPFSSGGNQYFYGQNTETRFWFIQQVLPNGTMGSEKTNGFWGHVQNTHTEL